MELANFSGVGKFVVEWADLQWNCRIYSGVGGFAVEWADL